MRHLLFLLIFVVLLNPIHAAEIIVDNDSAGTQATGTWQPSSGKNSYGTQSLYSREIGATYRFTLSIPEPGLYDVNLWWTDFFNRSTNVAIDVVHRDGTETIFVNQKQNGGQWNNIGSWYFATDAVVIIHSNSTSKSTGADAVQLISIPDDLPPDDLEIIVDNNQPGTQAMGTWQPSSGENSYGTQSLYSREIGATYRYTLSIPEPGVYDVNLWWTEYFNRSTNVAIDIVHRDGTQTVFVNQKQNGGQWNNIGSWYFATDAVVIIHSNSTSKSTGADAVQLISADPGGSSNSAPTLSGTPTTIVATDTAYSFIPSANDTEGDTLTFQISNKPDWASFNTLTGALTGTPDSNDEGTTHNILITVSDGQQATSMQVFSITVVRNTVQVILDNNQPGTEATGNWQRSSGLNSYGTPSLYSREVGATYRYTLSVSEPGYYDVNLWWTEYFNRSTNVAVDIAHRNGIRTVFVNQKQNGGQWNRIGSLYFDTNAIVTIHSNSTSQSTGADAVQLVSSVGNDAPRIGDTPTIITVAVDTAYNFIPRASDDNNDHLAFNIRNKPDWADFDTRTGALTGIPVNGDEGITQNILITVNDGYETVSMDAFDITVTQGAVSDFLIDPTPATGDRFGSVTRILTNGNIVISEPEAVYLYNPVTQKLIASIEGYRESSGIAVLKNNNFVIVPISDDYAGSMQLVNGDTGIIIGKASPEIRPTDGDLPDVTVHALKNGNFVISELALLQDGAASSLISGVTGMQIGSLPGFYFTFSLADSNNFVVTTAPWAGGGSIRLINGFTGAQIGASLVGGRPNDNSVRLTNGNLVITTVQYNNNFDVIGGNVNLINGTTGAQIGDTLVMLGDPDEDYGEDFRTLIVALNNGHFVFASPYVDDGIVQLINGTTGVQIGVTLAGNIMNSSYFGRSIISLANNNFVVMSKEGGGSEADKVQLINGTTGDLIGDSLTLSSLWRRGSTTLANGNFLVHFENIMQLINGETGELIGDSHPGERITALPNSNFVTIVKEGDKRTVRLISGTTSIQIGATLLVGDATGHSLRYYSNNHRATLLTNNNFAIISTLGDEGGVIDAGSVWIVSGVTGMPIGDVITGRVTGDMVGAWVRTSPTDDFYILALPYADNNGLEDSGQVQMISTSQ